MVLWILSKAVQLRGILYLDLVDFVMACLPISLQAVLPNWIRSFFSSGDDDDSFWGRDEESSTRQNSREAIRNVNSPNASAEAVLYRSGDSGFKNSRQIDTKLHSGQFAREFVFQAR